MQTLHEKGVPIDIISLFQQLGGNDLVYLTQLSAVTPTTANFAYHAKIVRDTFNKRKKHTIATTYLNEPSDDNEMALREALLLDDEDEEDAQERGFLEVGPKIIEKIYEEGSARKSTMSTGYIHLDRVLGGLEHEDLIIVAARPSVGKTAFALNVGFNVANCEEGAVSIFSAEMSKEKITYRLLSNMMAMDASVWKDPYNRLSVEDKDRALRAFTHISKLPLNIVAKAGPNVLDVEKEIIRNKKEYPDLKQLIVIDYLGLMSSVGKYERHDLKIGAITGTLKGLAVKYQVCIVLLSQLSRGVENRQDKRPMLSDIRDSGNIEQDADKVAFLYRDDYYERNSELSGIIEIIVAKNRDGTTGTVNLAFMKKFSKFNSLAVN
ncbi:replicative DNA helicase [Listeria cornellensis]|uniref:DNA 5'-3' helicase n=1 Tax=Listeria cornellensis FSL F6-0969 TaxID=1265820 RepID=W7BN87_9LIST|nr:DnaB-like helicase C-terminal domain-containing protein [Listeria cornellensis]EUJ27352.1 replicative DNA helicase [Listeria cornellensis FSL F6-0969]